jgi:hypothetical protein
VRHSPEIIEHNGRNLCFIYSSIDWLHPALEAIRVDTLLPLNDGITSVTFAEQQLGRLTLSDPECYALKVRTEGGKMEESQGRGLKRRGREEHKRKQENILGS